MEEVKFLRKELKKNQENEEILLESLEKLSRMDVNRKILKESGVGKSVASLASKANFDTVKIEAKKLLKKWKENVKHREMSAVSVSSTEKSVDDSSEFPEEKVRAQACKFFLSAFPKSSAAKKAKHIAIEIEKELYSLFDESLSKDYKVKVRSLKFNLSKNSVLIQNLIEDKLSPSDLVKMSSEELASAEIKQKRSKESEKLFNEARSDWLDSHRDDVNKQAGIAEVGGLFPCENCKSTKTTHYQKQTRGADEPMTIFAQCTECGHNWRFGDE
eukprot:maker-scaffold_49-snap-gene-1.92-mRNA-1 protein AED:0.32 eAED:0.32 QI:125/1/1/1/1/1/2/71/272